MCAQTIMASCAGHWFTGAKMGKRLFRLIPPLSSHLPNIVLDGVQIPSRKLSTILKIIYDFNLSMVDGFLCLFFQCVHKIWYASAVAIFSSDRKKSKIFSLSIWFYNRFEFNGIVIRSVLRMAFERVLCLAS